MRFGSMKHQLVEGKRGGQLKMRSEPMEREIPPGTAFEAQDGTKYVVDSHGSARRLQSAPKGKKKHLLALRRARQRMEQAEALASEAAARFEGQP